MAPPSHKSSKKKRLPSSRAHNDPVILKATLYLVLAAGYSSLSQLNLSPVYGSIPSFLYHSQTEAATVLLAIFAAVVGPLEFLSTLEHWSPVLAFWTPTIQSTMFTWSSHLGPVAGPIFTEALTTLPLLFSSTVLITRLGFGLKQGRHVAATGLGFGAFALMQILENLSTRLITFFISSASFVVSPLLQIILAIFHTSLAPSKLLWLAAPSLLHSALYNVHMPFPGRMDWLNRHLKGQAGFTVLARSESLTGYVSVIESKNREFRAMRCGHSLLGGEWLSSQSSQKDPTGVKDPIYAVFVMLEAVRLVEVKKVKRIDPRVSNDTLSKEALVMLVFFEATSRVHHLYSVAEASVLVPRQPL